MVDLTKCAHYPNWEQKQDMALGEEFPSKKSQPRRGGAEVEGLERRNRKSSLRKRKRKRGIHNKRRRQVDRERGRERERAIIGVLRGEEEEGKRKGSPARSISSPSFFFSEDRLMGGGQMRRRWNRRIVPRLLIPQRVSSFQDHRYTVYVARKDT